MILEDKMKNSKLFIRIMVIILIIAMVLPTFAYALAWVIA